MLSIGETWKTERY